jgi:uncharacterized protein YjiS (DUF1127 family)
MSTTTITFHTPHRSRWDQLRSRFTEWRRRSRSRYELSYLSDATLNDIGVTRCDVYREMNKPFWTA